MNSNCNKNKKQIKQLHNVNTLKILNLKSKE